MPAWPDGDAEIAVITPHYDCAPYLAQAVGSILAQRDVSLGLFVIDDCSPTEDWKAALAPFRHDRRLVVLQTSRNVGPYRIDNWMIARLRAPYVAFQDADDFSAPDRLRRQLDALEAARADIVGCDFHEISEAGEIERTRHMPRHVNFAISRGRDHSLLHPTSLMRRAVLTGLGGFDGGGQRFGADTEFALRASFAARLRNLPVPLYYYRRRAASLTLAAATGYDSAPRIAYHQAILRAHRARRAAWLRSLLRLGPPPSLAAAPDREPFEIAPVDLAETRAVVAR